MLVETVPSVLSNRVGRNVEYMSAGGQEIGYCLLVG